jgi:hypothetical protein
MTEYKCSAARFFVDNNRQTQQHKKLVYLWLSVLLVRRVGGGGAFKQACVNVCRYSLQNTRRKRLKKQVLNYHPKGRRRPGRSLKRLLDDMTAETETGHPGLNSWWNIMMMMITMMMIILYRPSIWNWSYGYGTYMYRMCTLVCVRLARERTNQFAPNFAAYSLRPGRYFILVEVKTPKTVSHFEFQWGRLL